MARGGARPNSGPKARPVADKVREGTYRPHRDGPAEGVRPPDGVRPRMPAGLSTRARTAWRILLDDLEGSSLLDSADAPLYEAFAVNLARAREARVAVEKYGTLVEGAGGRLVGNPAIKIEREAMREVRMLSAELAIGMSARARLGMAVARGARSGSSPAPSEGAEQHGGLGPSPRLRAVK